MQRRPPSLPPCRCCQRWPGLDPRPEGEVVPVRPEAFGVTGELADVTVVWAHHLKGAASENKRKAVRQYDPGWLIRTTIRGGRGPTAGHGVLLAQV